MSTLSPSEQNYVKGDMEGEIHAPLSTETQRRRFVPLGNSVAVSGLFLDHNGGELNLSGNGDESYQTLEMDDNRSTPTVVYSGDDVQHRIRPNLGDRYESDVTSRGAGTAARANPVESGIRHFSDPDQPDLKIESGCSPSGVGTGSWPAVEEDRGIPTRDTLIDFTDRSVGGTRPKETSEARASQPTPVSRPGSPVASTQPSEYYRGTEDSRGTSVPRVLPDHRRGQETFIRPRSDNVAHLSDEVLFYDPPTSMQRGGSAAYPPSKDENPRVSTTLAYATEGLGGPVRDLGLEESGPVGSLAMVGHHTLSDSSYGLIGPQHQAHRGSRGNPEVTLQPIPLQDEYPAPRRVGRPAFTSIDHGGGGGPPYRVGRGIRPLEVGSGEPPQVGDQTHPLGRENFHPGSGQPPSRMGRIEDGDRSHYPLGELNGPAPSRTLSEGGIHRVPLTYRPERDQVVTEQEPESPASQSALLLELTQQLARSVEELSRRADSQNAVGTTALTGARSLLDTFHREPAPGGTRGESYALVLDPRGDQSRITRPRDEATERNPPQAPCHLVRDDGSEGSSCEEGHHHRRSHSCDSQRDEVKVRVNDFRGSSDPLSLSMFLIEFQDAAEIAGWTYAPKGRELRVRLKSTALLAVQSLAIEDRIDFNNLARALCAEFIPPSATISAHMQLSSCVQGEKGVGAYGEHLRRLAMLAYPPGSPEGVPAIRDRRALERFTVTLSDGHLRVKVLEGRPRTLRQAVNIAEEYMAILNPTGHGSEGTPAPTYPMTTGGNGGSQDSRKGKATPQGPGGGVGVPALGIEALLKAIAELTALLAKGQQTPNQAQGGNKPSGATWRNRGGQKQRGKPGAGNTECNRLCFRCGKAGHFVRECTSGGLNCLQASCISGLSHACACGACHFPGTPNGQGPPS